jgi:hypothetical protein
MYKDIGKKIMKIAQWGSLVINGIALLASIGWCAEGLVEGALLCCGISVFCTLASWPLYGFGQLVDDIHAMRGQSAEPTAQNDELPEL